jgi:hypothetical protein
MKRKRALRQSEIEELRRRWQEGIDSGSAGLLDMQEIKRKARERLFAGKSMKGGRLPDSNK